MHGLQAEVHVLNTDTNMLPQPEMAWQQKKLQAALDFHCDGYGQVEFSKVARLVASMWHPEPALRVTAAEIAATVWLEQAAQSPLQSCPVTLG